MSNGLRTQMEKGKILKALGGASEGIFMILGVGKDIIKKMQKHKL